MARSSGGARPTQSHPGGPTYARGRWRGTINPDGTINLHLPDPTNPTGYTAATLGWSSRRITKTINLTPASPQPNQQPVTRLDTTSLLAADTGTRHPVPTAELAGASFTIIPTGRTTWRLHIHVPHTPPDTKPTGPTTAMGVTLNSGLNATWTTWTTRTSKSTWWWWASWASWTAKSTTWWSISATLFSSPMATLALATKLLLLLLVVVPFVTSLVSNKRTSYSTTNLTQCTVVSADLATSVTTGSGTSKIREQTSFTIATLLLALLLVVATLLLVVLALLLVVTTLLLVVVVALALRAPVVISG